MSISCSSSLPQWGALSLLPVLPKHKSLRFSVKVLVALLLGSSHWGANSHSAAHQHCRGRAGVEIIIIRRTTHRHAHSVLSSPHYPTERELGPVVSVGLTSVLERRASCNLLPFMHIQHDPGTAGKLPERPGSGYFSPWSPSAPLFLLPIFAAPGSDQMETLLTKQKELG